MIKILAEVLVGRNHFQLLKVDGGCYEITKNGYLEESFDRLTDARKYMRLEVRTLDVMEEICTGKLVYEKTNIIGDIVRVFEDTEHGFTHYLNGVAKGWDTNKESAVKHADLWLTITAMDVMGDICTTDQHR